MTSRDGHPQIDLRVAVHTGFPTYVVGSRQARPNLPEDGCPFWPGARLHVEIVSPWRAPAVTRYIAAGELGSGVFFNPVAPEAAAQSLRKAVPARP